MNKPRHLVAYLLVVLLMIGQDMSPVEYRIILKYRHMISLFMVDAICPVVARHACRDLRQEGSPVKFLTDPSDERSKLRPPDILVFRWVGGKHACVDLTGVSPLVGLSNRGFIVGHAALKAASCKVTKHE
ncbi:hypothetical protein Tco_1090254 [Tanacetum coccineum]|uniref:Uncharacterized protein n=1 Tax=Tanacetum coccineum TaxID=301880 RepID=A0ABQ5I4U6_9ASTR